MRINLTEAEARALIDLAAYALDDMEIRLDAGHCQYPEKEEARVAAGQAALETFATQFELQLEG